MVVKQRLQAAHLAPIPLVKFRASRTTRFARTARLRAAGVGLVTFGLALLVARSSLGHTAPIATAPEVVSAPVVAPESPPLPEPAPAEPPVVEALPVEIAPPIAPATRVSPPVPRRLCQPDARWRAAAQVNLQELQQLAAQKGHWATFERLEPLLSSAIDEASTPEQCDAADQQIRKLAMGWRQ
jgi:hypothetical protein